jgi:hypothetical protein
MAIFHGHHVGGCRFATTFYRQVLCKSVTLEDIRTVDPDLYRGFVWML